MSRGTEEIVEGLQRKAQHKVKAIRRVVREYNQTLDASNDDHAVPVVEKQQEMERLVGEYVKLYRAFKRARKKQRKANGE